MTALVDTRESVEAMAGKLSVNAADSRWDEDHHRAAAMLRRLLDRAVDAERAAKLESMERISALRLAREANMRVEAAEAAPATARADALREAADLLTRIAAEADAREPGGGPFGLVARYAENTRALAGDILALIHPTTTGET